MKFKSIAAMSSEERGKKLRDLELELIKLNAQVATGTPPKNTGQLRRLKKDIARLKMLEHLEVKLKKKKSELSRLKQEEQKNKTEDKKKDSAGTEEKKKSAPEKKENKEKNKK